MGYWLGDVGGRGGAQRPQLIILVIKYVCKIFVNKKMNILYIQLVSVTSKYYGEMSYGKISHGEMSNGEISGSHVY